MQSVSVLCVLACIAAASHGYKILGIFPTMAKSHYIVGSALMKGLAEQGHEVTVVSPFPLKMPMKNYRDIPMVSILEASKSVMDNILDMTKLNVIEGFVNLFDMGIMLTNATFKDPVVQKFLKSNEKFDVVVMEVFVNEAMLGFAHLFKAPVIGVSTFGASLWASDMVGTPSPPSYVPNPFLSFTDHMTLTERIGNLAITIFERVFNDFFYLPRQEALYEENFPNPKPPLRELRKNASLVLLNSHFSLGYPRPYVPNMIEVGGMHVNRKPKPLPADIKKYLDSAKDGVIYFSMGSNLKSKLLPKEKLQHLLNTFKSLKQKVLWKFEDKNLPGKSDNILISDWFPQDDILAHPNVKLFITHGGLLSTTEAIYHGVPIIGIPMFGDQFLNMARAVRTGFGLTVNYNELTTETLKIAINEMLTNNKYTQKMKEISARYRDQPMNPLDTAIYWVEYVARHKGAPHLHSGGQNLSFIEYHNIDALAILFGGVFIVIYLLIAMIKKLLLMCFRKNPSKSVQKKKKTH